MCFSKRLLYMLKAGGVKTNRLIPSSAVGAGFACPKTQSKLFSGERTSPLRTKRQHYPRFDTPRFKKNIINTLSSRSCRRFLILHLFLSAPIVTITLASAIYFICLCLLFHLFSLSFRSSTPEVEIKGCSFTTGISNPINFCISFK